MNKEEYLKERVDHQILWYDKKAIRYRIMYVRIQMLIMLFALFVPILLIFSLFYPISNLLITLVASSFSVITAFLVALQSFQNYKEQWAAYRTTAESLKSEKYLFSTQSGKYAGCDEKEGFDLFVSNIEGTIAQEQTQWSKLVKAHREFSPESEMDK